MTEDALEILSAFVDGEAVAPDVLAEALAAPGAREALVDLARLRAELGADDARPSERFYAAMGEVLGQGPAHAPRAWRALRAAAAVVLLALAVLGGMSVPERLRGRAADEPPRAARVLHFTPGVDWHEGGLK